MMRAFCAILALLVALFPAVAEAASGSVPVPNPSTGDDGLNTGTSVNFLVNFAVAILNLLRSLGAIIVIAGYIINGYKLAASPDPRKRAEAMEGLVHTTIGALIVFSSHLLAGWLKGFAQGVQ
ncbi:MAG: pilin [Bacillota bacterium]